MQYYKEFPNKNNNFQELPVKGNTVNLYGYFDATVQPFFKQNVYLTNWKLFS